MNEVITNSEVAKFELEQRKARAFAASVFFPASLRGRDEIHEIGNAIIVMDMASRMNLPALEVAQAIYIIHGKPSFETKFLVARLNQSGLIKGRLITKISDDKQSAYCVATDASTGEQLCGSTVTMAMAQAEGWTSKNGSKWRTMPELMLKYRAQSFFINEYYPEVKGGLKSTDEAYDTPDISVENSTDIRLDLNAIAQGDKTQNADESEIIEPELSLED